MNYQTTNGQTPMGCYPGMRTGIYLIQRLADGTTEMQIMGDQAVTPPIILTAQERETLIGLLRTRQAASRPHQWIESVAPDGAGGMKIYGLPEPWPEGMGRPGKEQDAQWLFSHYAVNDEGPVALLSPAEVEQVIEILESHR